MRLPTPRELQIVLDHVAKAPFSTRVVAVHRSIRGHVFHGRKLGKSEPSIVAHLAKRILLDQEWATGVTADEYLAHLHGVALDPDVQIVVHRLEDERLRLGLFAPNRIPARRLGVNAKGYLWVVYLVGYGTITTGFQVTGSEKINLPQDVRWL